MSWSTIRRANDSDTAAVKAAAERFCRRHSIDTDGGQGAEFALDCVLNPARGDTAREERARHLRPLWRRIVRRVLGSPDAEGVAYGYVGYSVE